jgi:hypothetical protein
LQLNVGGKLRRVVFDNCGEAIAATSEARQSKFLTRL